MGATLGGGSHDAKNPNVSCLHTRGPGIVSARVDPLGPPKAGAAMMTSLLSVLPGECRVWNSNFWNFPNEGDRFLVPEAYVRRRQLRWTSEAGEPHGFYTPRWTGCRVPTINQVALAGPGVARGPINRHTCHDLPGTHLRLERRPWCVPTCPILRLEYRHWIKEFIFDLGC